MIILDVYIFVVYNEIKKFCYLFIKMWVFEIYIINVLGNYFDNWVFNRNVFIDISFIWFLYKCRLVGVFFYNDCDSDIRLFIWDFFVFGYYT